jgi:hypothetical protein
MLLIKEDSSSLEQIKVTIIRLRLGLTINPNFRGSDSIKTNTLLSNKNNKKMTSNLKGKAIIINVEGASYTQFISRTISSVKTTRVPVTMKLELSKKGPQQNLI